LRVSSGGEEDVSIKCFEMQSKVQKPAFPNPNRFF